MNKAEKAAVKAAGFTTLLGGAAVMLLGTPVAWGAVVLGAYQVGKKVYQKTKDSAKLPPEADETLFI